MTTYQFKPVAISGEKNLPCPVCGKKAKRNRTFSQTLNPFNLGDDGEPKTRPQILAELQAEWREWLQQPEAHVKCLDGVA